VRIVCAFRLRCCCCYKHTVAVNVVSNHSYNVVSHISGYRNGTSLVCGDTLRCYSLWVLLLNATQVEKHESPFEDQKASRCGSETASRRFESDSDHTSTAVGIITWAHILASQEVRCVLGSSQTDS
jgi:hypothetical protein